MVKSITVVIVGVAVGLVAGAVSVRSRLTPQLREIAAERYRLERECKRLEEEAVSKAALLDGMRRENDALLEDLARLEAQFEKTASAPPEPKDAYGLWSDVPTESGDVDPDEAAVWDESLAASPGTEEATADENAEQRDTPRRDAAARFQKDVQDFLYAQIEGASDPAVRDRLTALAEYSDYIMDLVRQLREAETDAERESIRQELDEARANARRLLQQQRADMLRQVAKEQGLDTTAQQDAFVRSMRRVLANPLFSVRDDAWTRGGPRRSGGPQRSPLGPRRDRGGGP